MREHGVLRRVMFLYDEAIRRLDTGESRAHGTGAARSATEGALGQHALALQHHQQAVAMHTKLQEPKSPNVPHARAFLGETLFELGRAEEGEQVLRGALLELAPSRKNAPNLYWEPLALLTRVACANRAADCEALRQETRLTGKVVPGGADRSGRRSCALRGCG